MSGVSLPVTRPIGRALIIGTAACRAQPQATLQRLGFGCADVEDPFSAMRLLGNDPNAFGSVVICLNCFFREELVLVDAIKRRYPQIEIWIAQSDGRAGALAEAMRLGADGLLAEDGLHRTAISESAVREDRETCSPEVSTPVEEEESADDREGESLKLTEPLLSAEELRALLADTPEET